MTSVLGFKTGKGGPLPRRFHTSTPTDHLAASRSVAPFPYFIFQADIEGRHLD